ncbi:MAG TPA: type II secretion system protein [Pyrinomonadaceae bacterium]|nr:type II secretion system protein [Pyrinomonadaceae bacterium]
MLKRQNGSAFNVSGKFETPNGISSTAGYSLIETLIVFALIGVLTSIALPQIIVQRRLTRSVGIPREIMTQLREARQLAMSQRQAFTFRYDNTAKQISVIDHNSNPGGSLLSDPAFPTTAGSKVILSVPLAESSVSADMAYGIPTGLPAAALGDGIALTPLNNQAFTVTFQPDGSVIKSNGDPDDRAFFIYNARAPQATASAISIVGASGRVKLWRYDKVANVYAE